MNVRVAKQTTEYKDIDLDLPLYLYYQDIETNEESYYKITENEVICLESKGNVNTFYKYNYQHLSGRFLNYAKSNEEMFEEIKTYFLEELNDL